MNLLSKMTVIAQISLENRPCLIRIKFRQQGVAIISVLIIVAAVSVLATKMTADQKKFIKTSEYMVNYQKNLLLTLSVEAWAQNLLTQDLVDNKIDLLTDKWSQDLADSTVGNTTLSGQIIDQQSKINLNNLTQYKKLHFLSQINHLFDQLKINKKHIDALIDYLDKDNNPYSVNGAEESFYSKLEPPYIIANRSMTDLSELYLVRGFTYDIIQQLTPFIWVGPTRVTTINVNTVQETVLKSLSTKFTNKKIQEIIDKQQDKGFMSVNEFITFIAPVSVNKKLLTVASTHFLLKSQIDSPQLGLKVHSYLSRNKNNKPPVRFIRRKIL